MMKLLRRRPRPKHRRAPVPSVAGRRAWLGAVLGAVLMVTPLTLIVNGAASASTNFASTLGIYQNGADPTANAATLGLPNNRFPFVQTFVDGSSTPSIAAGAAGIAQYASSLGSRLIAPFNMLPNSGVSFPQAAAGAMDPTAKAFAQALVDNGQADAVVRIGWEFNGGWFPWGQGQNGNSQVLFVQTWQNEVNAMRSVAGQHLLFYWNPTVDCTNSWDGWYPGDAYVDVVGLDLYDQTCGAWSGSQAAWDSYLNDPTGLNSIASLAAAHSKQIGFGEVGTGWNAGSNGGDDAFFWSSLASWVQGQPVLFTALWNDGNGLFDGSHPLSVAALQAAVGAGGPPPPPPPTTTIPPPTTTTTVPPPTTTTTLPPPPPPTTLPPQRCVIRVVAGKVTGTCSVT